MVYDSFNLELNSVTILSGDFFAFIFMKDTGFQFGIRAIS